MTSKILAVDTATENCSVALKVGNDIIARCEMAPREHTTKILPMVDEVLSEAGVALNELERERKRSYKTFCLKNRLLQFKNYSKWSIKGNG